MYLEPKETAEEEELDPADVEQAEAAEKGEDSLPSEEDLARGAAFEKVDVYDRCLDEPNPWHPEIQTELFPSQIIGFRWMLDRYKEGGGLVLDKVGSGKVSPRHPLKLTLRHSKRLTSCLPLNSNFTRRQQMRPPTLTTNSPAPSHFSSFPRRC